MVCVGYLEIEQSIAGCCRLKKMEQERLKEAAGDNLDKEEKKKKKK